MAWDATKPASAEAKSLAPAQIQGNWAVLEDWLNDLGNFPTTPAAFNAGINGWTLIQTQTAAGAATVDFTSGLSSTYNEYIVTMSSIIPATNASNLILRMSQSAVFLSGASDYRFANIRNFDSASGVSEDCSTGTTGITLAFSLSNSTADSLNGYVRIFTPASTAVHKLVEYRNAYWVSSSLHANVAGTGGLYLNTTAVDGLRFLMNAGNIIGTFALYGVRKT